MAQITTVLPQDQHPTAVVTIGDLLSVLPDTLPIDLNVWIGGRIARDGKTASTLVFLIESEEEPSAEIKQYFSSLVQPLGIQATVSNAWRNESITAMRLYNLGRLIVDKSTCQYTELPGPIVARPDITVQEIIAKLPDTIPFTETLWLTGSLVKNGWSCKDVDILVGSTTDFTDAVAAATLSAIRKFFVAVLECRVDVGARVMPEREPVFVFKLYESGNKCPLPI